MANNKLSMRIAAVLLSTTMLASVPLSTIYAEDEDLTNQLSGIEQQMQEAGNRKANAEITITNVSEQLHQIQVELDQATANLKSYEQQRMAVENEIVKNEKLLAEAQARLATREGVFNKRVRDIYINGRLSYLEVIIGAKDFSDFANRVEMLRRIIDADIKLISSIKTDTTADDTSDSSSDYSDGYTDDESSTGETASKYNFYVKLDNDKDLMMGQHVLIEQDNGQDEQKEGMWLPSAYIKKNNNKYYVWLDSHNKLKLHEIQVGEYDENLDEYEVKSGLKTSDYIACDDSTLKEGMKVTKVSPEDNTSGYGDEQENDDAESFGSDASEDTSDVGEDYSDYSDSADTYDSSDDGSLSDGADFGSDSSDSGNSGTSDSDIADFGE